MRKNQSRLDAFLTKKNCHQKENKSSDVIKLDSSTEEEVVSLEVYSKTYRNHESRTKLLSFPFVLIGPGDTIFYQPIIRPKMVALFENYGPEEARKFIEGNMRYHGAQNIENLSKMGLGTMFWNVSLFELLSFLVENINCISSHVRLLVEAENQIVELTRRQILAILGSMFFGIMPKQYQQSQTSFGGLMECSGRGNLKLNSSKIQKLKCIASYFSCMMDCKQKHSHLLDETVRFRRSSINSQSQSLFQQMKPMKTVEIMSLFETKIEDHYCQGIMVDFANKRLGGGVLGHGCIQEEILFSIFPELIAAKLICFQLQDAEAVIVQGARKFSYYSGYKETFKFEGSCFEEELHRDHEQSIIVAIDAYDFSLHKQSKYGLDQYSKKGIRRQLVKALAGFKETFLFVDESVPVVTGRWGCGAFRGDEDVKFLIQWLACSLSNRDMIYITSDPTQQKEYGCLSRQFKNQSSNQMLNILEKYFIFRSKLVLKQSLLSYIKHEVIL